MTFLATIRTKRFLKGSFAICFWICLSASQISHTEGFVQPGGCQESAGIHNQSIDTLQEAVIRGNLVLVKKLISEGIDINLVDEKGWTALDYAKKRNRKEIKSYLLENGARTFPKSIRDMSEGPHVSLVDSSFAGISYLYHDSIKNKSSIASNSYLPSVFPLVEKGILLEPFETRHESYSTGQEGIYSGSKKIFVVGDIHGEYERVFSLLKNSRVIDKQGNWVWGRGDLVFVGDIFDRGSKVTETLWLIYNLEKQAERSGGRVHLLLGNHEPMIFEGDLRYITDDYYSLCENLDLDYSELFDGYSLLGSWLRQQPLLIKIDDYLFVHGGISPELTGMKLAIGSINRLAWEYLNNKEKAENTIVRQFIFGGQGVLWYRGLVDRGQADGIIDEATLDKALGFYNARTIVVGHTEVDSISTFFGKKVIDVNIPKRDKDIIEQGLLIRGNKLWICYATGERIKG